MQIISTRFDYSRMLNYPKKAMRGGRGQLLPNFSNFPNLIHFLQSLQTNPVLTRCQPPTYCAPLSTYNNFSENHNSFFRTHAEWLYVNPIERF